MNIKAMIKKKFLNVDGTINKTVVASFITLLIVLIQQIMLACGFSYGHWDQVASIINTVLTLLGLCGFVEGNGEVEVPTHLVVKQSADGVTVTSKPAVKVSPGKIDIDANKIAFTKGGFQPSTASKAGGKQDENTK
ncbi:MAG: hypothetical protein ACLRX6_03055 [Limosilactobacillus pontis]|uniref:hypothetical protein n=1 Tax=Limosilactobacillus pontis TaxID=35787 RepID=UPI0039A27B16